MDEITRITAHYTYGTWRYQKGWAPLNITKAEGVYFWDSTGKRYLDLSSQLMCSNLGHQNQAVIDAICEQAKTMAFISPSHTCDIRAKLSVKLLEVLPKGLDKFFFTTSGTEANEAAFKIARMYTGKHKIIARYRSYHGSTGGSIAATGDLRRWYVEPAGKIPGVIFGPEADCYRCPIGHKDASTCGIACVDYIEHMIENDENVAAIIIEPIVGTNGVLVPPPGYLPKLAEMCKRRGVLVIADEVMSGWGRTGAWFASDHYGVVPDILCTAKGITSAMAPLGLVATSRAIGDFFDDHYFAHGHTYEAHPLTLAPAVAAIDEYKRLNLIERAKTMGEICGAKLKAMCAKHPSVGDVRGLGLFWAIDLAKDGKKTPFNTFQDKAARKALVIDSVVAEAMKRGVSVMGWINHLVIAPPLIVTEEQLDEACAAIDAGLEHADKAM